MPKIADQIIILKGRTLNEIYLDWARHEANGFRVKSIEKSSKWPQFWIKHYEVILYKSILIEMLDDGYHAQKAVDKLKKELL